ncbi:MAG TPA: hypothetical protein PK698_06495 [Bacilli bacterium]|nr:hypothetical protein [Bacilli bacterium]
MNYQEQCECCGGITSAYQHKINKQLVQALRQIVDYYEKEKKSCNLQKNLDLTKNQYNNFQKLQYFKLVQRTSAGWYPTELGVRFIYGEVPCWDRAITLGKRVLDQDHVAWKYKKQARLIFVKSIDDYSWKQKEEYQDEKRQTLFDKLNQY